MKVYLDYIFIQNFIVDYILIKETSYMARRNLQIKRGIIASLIASIYVILLIFLKIQELNYLLLKIFLAFVIIYISFKPEKVTDYIKLVGIFILVSAINVGVFTVISNLLKIDKVSFIKEIIFYIVGLSISKIYISRMWKIYKREIKAQDLIYDVKLNIGNNKYLYKGFLDTGNSVYSHIDKIPVIFAEKKNIDYSKIKELESVDIETITLSKKSLKKAYILDNIEISKGKNKWYVKAGVVFEDTKFSKNKDYNMILNYLLYTEEMGGIKV